MYSSGPAFQIGGSPIAFLLLVFGTPVLFLFSMLLVLQWHIGNGDKIELADLVRNPPGAFTIQFYALPIAVFVLFGGGIFGMSILEVLNREYIPELPTAVGFDVGIAIGAIAVMVLARLLNLPRLPN